MAMIQQPTPKRVRGMASIGDILTELLPDVPLNPLIDEDEPEDVPPPRIAINTTATHTIDSATCNEHQPGKGYCGQPATEGLCTTHRQDRIDWYEFMRIRQEEVSQPWQR